MPLVHNMDIKTKSKISERDNTVHGTSQKENLYKTTKGYYLKIKCVNKKS